MIFDPEPKVFHLFKVSDLDGPIGELSEISRTIRGYLFGASKNHIEYQRWSLQQEYKEVLETLILAYGYKCLKCSSVYRIEIDHVMPLARGGESMIDNLQLLCHTCNREKHNEYSDYRPFELDEGQAIMLNPRHPLR